LKTNRGFTLIEVVMTAGILACGLLAIASVFSFAVRTNVDNRQMAVATTLLYDRMEAFRSADSANPIWEDRDGSETTVVAGERYILVWSISNDPMRTVTVTVYAESDAARRRQAELVRATTIITSTF
jgi:Tfp pilus assembly protein PilV